MAVFICMNYIISEDKIGNVILNYINGYYDVDKVHSTPFHDDYGNPTDVATEYYLGDYEGDFQEEVFRVYQEGYWEKPDDPRKELTPILMVEDIAFVSNLNSMFGDRWIPVLKNWFEENFNEKIKTVDFY